MSFIIGLYPCSKRNMELTQEELAERIGVSVNFAGQVERGINAPSFETMQKIADVLQVPVRYFFDFFCGEVRIEA